MAKSYAELFQRLPGEAVPEHRRDGTQGVPREVLDLVLWPPTLYAVSHRQVAGLEGPDRGVGHGVQRRAWLRLLQHMHNYMREFDVWCSSVWRRPDPRRKVPVDPARAQKIKLTASECENALRELFGVIHRREKMTAAGFQKALEVAREQVVGGRYDLRAGQ